MSQFDKRAAWIATCILWAWAWAIGSIVWVPFTFGLSLLGLLLAGGSVWAMWIPIGVQRQPQQPAPWPPHALPAQTHYGHQPPTSIPPAPRQQPSPQQQSDPRR